jgi:carbonic anhydrase
LVVGHHGYSGVQAATDETRIGLADHWLRHVRDVRARHRELLDMLPSREQADALCELNVIEQTVNIAASSVLTDSWAGGQGVSLHGCVYSVRDGLLQDLHVSMFDRSDITASYTRAIEGVIERRNAWQRPCRTPTATKPPLA